MLNKLQVTLAFVGALITGSSYFTVTLHGAKKHVTLKRNGVSQAPTFNSINKLVSVLGVLSGYPLDVKIGNDTWRVTVDYYSKS